MAAPFIGEIKLFSFNAIPHGWKLCDGSRLAITQYQALYSLIGLFYGGSGNYFNLPDLRGRTLVGAYGQVGVVPYGLGSAGGQEQVALVAANLPLHSHTMMTSSAAGNASGANNIVYAQVATPSATNLYGPMSNPPVAIDPSTVQPTGSGAPHNNMQPYLTLVYCIATEGEYPQPGQLD